MIQPPAVPYIFVPSHHKRSGCQVMIAFSSMSQAPWQLHTRLLDTGALSPCACNTRDVLDLLLPWFCAGYEVRVYRKKDDVRFLVMKT
jgi:hypothetical protein